jgi:hypothetical protein
MSARSTRAPELVDQVGVLAQLIELEQTPLGSIAAA